MLQNEEDTLRAELAALQEYEGLSAGNQRRAVAKAMQLRHDKEATRKVAQLFRALWNSYIMVLNSVF